MSIGTADEPSPNRSQGRLPLSAPRLVVYADTYGAYHLDSVSELAGHIAVRSLHDDPDHTAEDLVAVIARELPIATATVSKLLFQTENCNLVGLVVSGLGEVELDEISTVAANLTIVEIGGTQGSTVVWLSRYDGATQVADTGSALWALWLAESPYAQELPDNVNWPVIPEAVTPSQGSDAPATPGLGDGGGTEAELWGSRTAKDPRRYRRRLGWITATLGIGIVAASPMLWLSHSWTVGLATFGITGAFVFLWWAQERTRALLRQANQRNQRCFNSLGESLRLINVVLAASQSAGADTPITKAQADNMARLTAASGIVVAQVKELILQLEKDHAAH